MRSEKGRAGWRGGRLDGWKGVILARTPNSRTHSQTHTRFSTHPPTPPSRFIRTPKTQHVLLLAALILASLTPCHAAPAPGLPRGKPAPAFQLFDIHGKEYRLADFKGKPTVINFWAFWCDTWKEELPHLAELAGRQHDMGFRIVAISVDGTRLREFRKRTGGKLPYPVLLDVGGKVSAKYQITGVPTVVILDSAGRVQSFRVGCQSAAVLLDTLRGLGRK